MEPVRGPELRMQETDACRQAGELLLAALLVEPERADRCTEVVETTGCGSAELQQIFTELCRLEAAGTFTVDKLNDALTGEAQSALARIRIKQLPAASGERMVDDCLRQLRRSHLEREYERHRLLADEYERSADERFMQELMETQRIKNEIKKLYGN